MDLNDGEQLLIRVAPARSPDAYWFRGTTDELSLVQPLDLLGGRTTDSV